MKRTKFVVGALVLSMGLAGTGYALWSDTLEVKATVNTGKFDIQVESTSTPGHYYKAVDGSWTAQDTKYTRMNIDGVNNKRDSVEFRLNNLVPGGRTRLDVVTVNGGDVVAQLKNITGSVTSENAILANDLIVHIGVMQEANGKVDYIASTTLADIVNGRCSLPESKAGSLTIDAKEKVHLAIELELDSNSVNATQNAQATVELKFAYEQVLAPKAEKPGNGGNGNHGNGNGGNGNGNGNHGNGK